MVAKKAVAKTMGPAQVETRPPNNFLKKHEKEPKLGPSKHELNTSSQVKHFQDYINWNRARWPNR